MPSGAKTKTCPWCGGGKFNPLFADSEERGELCRVCKGTGLVRFEWIEREDGSILYTWHDPRAAGVQEELQL